VLFKSQLLMYSGALRSVRVMLPIRFATAYSPSRSLARAVAAILWVTRSRH
jgi:hypothetical protein